MDLLVELISIGEHTVVGRLEVEAEDSTAEGTQPCELIHVVEHDVEGLVTTPRQSCHRTVVAIGLRTEVGIDIRNQVVQQYGIERSTVVGHALTTTHACLDVTTLHDHNHRHSLTTGDSVVHDVLHLSLQGPTGLAFAHTMLQIEHRIALLEALLLIVLSRGIDHCMTPGLLLVAVVVDAAYTTSGHTLLWTVVVALRTLRHLETTSLTVRSEEGLRSGIDEVHAVDIHEVIVEAHGQRICHSHEDTIALRLHLILLAADVDDNLLGLRRIDTEVGTTLRVYLGEVVARNGVLTRHSISRHVDLLDGHRQIGGTLGLVA